MAVRIGGLRARGTRDLVPDWAPAAGAIRTLSLNTRAAIDPKNDALANPAYPGRPPWDVIGGTQWDHITDFCGAVFVPGLMGGTYMMYASAGHSAGGPCMWIGWPLATRQWQRIGRRPLPTDSLTLAAANPANVGAYYPVEQFDAGWGDWRGDYSGWPAGFAQPGYNPPEGSHTRNVFPYRPGSKAGNTYGEIICCWQPTGVHTGTGIRGSWVYDIDTGLFSRTANLRPDAGGATGGHAYFESLDCVVGLNMVGSGYTSVVDVLDCPTRTWVRRAVSNSFWAEYDSTSFAHGELYVLVSHKRTADAVPFTLWAIDGAALKAGTATGWTQLSVAASSWPVDSAGLTITVAFAWSPTTQTYYAVNRVHGSTKVWKLAPPANPLAGTWTLSEEVLAGEALDARLAAGTAGASFDYSRLHYAPGAASLLWTPDYVGGPVQGIRPLGVH